VNTYDERKTAGDAAERIVEQWLRSKGYAVNHLSLEKQMPVEATYVLNGLMNDNPLLRWYRYLPDYEVLTPTGRIYIDAKASEFIERNCYEHYLDIEEKLGIPVYLALAFSPKVVTLLRVKQIVFAQQDWVINSNNGSGTPYKTIVLDKSKPKIIQQMGN
jgi:hypothetical protein